MEVHYWEFVPIGASAYDELLEQAHADARAHMADMAGDSGAEVSMLPVYRSEEYPQYDVVTASADLPHPDTDHVDDQLDAAWHDLHDGTAAHANDDEVAALTEYTGEATA